MSSSSSSGCAYNTEVAEKERQASFHGLDLYSLYTSIGEVLTYADVALMLRTILARRMDFIAHEDGEAFFSAAQNARVVKAAEAYYRTMYYGGAASWNLRDQHMFDTLKQLLDLSFWPMSARESRV